MLGRVAAGTSRHGVRAILRHRSDETRSAALPVDGDATPDRSGPIGLCGKRIFGRACRCATGRIRLHRPLQHLRSRQRARRATGAVASSRTSRHDRRHRASVGPRSRPSMKSDGPAAPATCLPLNRSHRSDGVEDRRSGVDSNSDNQIAMNQYLVSSEGISDTEIGGGGRPRTDPCELVPPPARSGHRAGVLLGSRLELGTKIESGVLWAQHLVWGDPLDSQRIAGASGIGALSRSAAVSNASPCRCV